LIMLILLNLKMMLFLMVVK
jgi:hypothetical protein